VISNAKKRKTDQAQLRFHKYNLSLQRMKERKMGKKLRSPIIWFGGKGHLVNKLLPLIPRHKIYVEPFGGGANLLVAKEPSQIEVYNDLDSGLVNFFRVLRDKNKFQKFYEQVVLMPYSREEYYECRETWDKEEDDVQMAVKWFVVARQSFSGIFGRSWGYTVTNSVRGMANPISKYWGAIDMLPEVAERLLRVQIEHNDFRKILKAYDTENTFFYLDPPYVLDTRTEAVYRYEMALEDHQELVDMLLHITGKAMLSGYDHEVYKPLEEAGWTKLVFEAMCWVTGRTRAQKHIYNDSNKHKLKRKECVWLNYVPAPHKQMELLGVKYGTENNVNPGNGTETQGE